MIKATLEELGFENVPYPFIPKYIAADMTYGEKCWFAYSDKPYLDPDTKEWLCCGDTDAYEIGVFCEDEELPEALKGLCKAEDTLVEVIL